MPRTAHPLHRPAALLAALASLCLGGCSLLSLNSPERPLSTRDLNTRLVTRQFSAAFVSAIEQTADDIARDPDPQVQRNVLRWKIAATASSEAAALQLAPRMALLDTWAFTSQMRAFFAPGGAGHTAFGREQPQAVALAAQWDEAAAAMARELLPAAELARYQQFVSDYAAEHPLANLRFARPSVVQLWLQRGGADTPLLDEVGTIPQALADTSDRVQVLSGSLPSQAMWRTQLALNEAGLGGGDLHGALSRLDERLAHLTAVAEGSPQLVREAVGEVRRSLLEVVARLDASQAATLATLRSERIALSATISTEREALLKAADEQRQALAVNATDLAQKVVVSSGNEARRLMRELVLLGLVLFLIVLGLPFAAGYLLGRARERRAGMAPR